MQSERSALEKSEAAVQLELLADRELIARKAGETARQELEHVLQDLQTARTQETDLNTQLDESRASWQGAQGQLVSLEALQQAALGQAQGRVMEWLASHSFAARPRLAQQIRVQKGWERAVETVLGGYLEAVCVDGLDAVTAVLDQLDAGQVSFLIGQDGERGRCRPKACSPRSKVRQRSTRSWGRSMPSTIWRLHWYVVPGCMLENRSSRATASGSASIGCA